MKEGVLGLQLCFKKKTLARVFSCQFCDIFKSTFFYETHPVAASLKMKKVILKNTLALNQTLKIKNTLGKYLEQLINKVVANYVKAYLMSGWITVKRCTVRKGVLRNFAKFTGKHLCQILFFNKVAGLGTGVFLVNFGKFLRIPLFTEHLYTTAFASTYL